MCVCVCVRVHACIQCENLFVHIQTQLDETYSDSPKDPANQKVYHAYMYTHSIYVKLLVPTVNFHWV